MSQSRVQNACRIARRIREPCKPLVSAWCNCFSWVNIDWHSSSIRVLHCMSLEQSFMNLLCNACCCADNPLDGVPTPCNLLGRVPEHLFQWRITYSSELFLSTISGVPATLTARSAMECSTAKGSHPSLRTIANMLDACICMPSNQFQSFAASIQWIVSRLNCPQLHRHILTLKTIAHRYLRAPCLSVRKALVPRRIQTEAFFEFIALPMYHKQKWTHIMHISVDISAHVHLPCKYSTTEPVHTKTPAFFQSAVWYPLKFTPGEDVFVFDVWDTNYRSSSFNAVGMIRSIELCSTKVRHI